MLKKTIFATAALLVLTGCASRLPEDELRMTSGRLSNYLFQEESLTQSEMTILSEYLLKLANMERYMIEYRIWNQPGYEKIEKQFMADCERWDKETMAEAQKPGEFEGGSMEPMDRNLRMTNLVRKRIDELKTRWLAKP